MILGRCDALATASLGGSASKRRGGRFGVARYSLSSLSPTPKNQATNC